MSPRVVQAQSAEETAFVAEHPVVRYAADPDFAPIDFVVGREHRGLAKDYLDIVAGATGLRFERRPYASWAEALAAFRAGEVDALSGAFVSEERKTFALFSEPYFRLGGAIVTVGGGSAIRTVDQLDSQKVGWVDGSVWREALGESVAHLDLVAFPDIRFALRALVDGQVNALIADPVSTIYQAKQLGLAERIAITGQLDLQAPLAIAVRPDWPVLQRMIDRALSGVSVEREQALRKRWIGVPESTNTESSVPTLPDAVRPQIEAMQAQLTESDSAQLDALKLALQLEDQAEALIAGIASQPSPAPDKSALPVAEEELRDFLLWRASLPERASSEQLQNLLDVEQASLIAAEQRRDQAATRLRELAQRQLAIPVDIDQARARQTASSEEEQVADSPSQRLLVQARRRLALVEAVALQAEIARNPERNAQALRDLRSSRREVALLRQRMAALNDLQRARVVRDAQARLIEIEQTRDGLNAQGGELADIAQRNVELAELLVTYAQRYADLVPSTAEQTRVADEVSQSLDLTRQRLQLDVHGAGLGKVLAAELLNLEPPRQARLQLRDMQGELASLRLQQIELSSRREQIADSAALNFADDEDQTKGQRLSVEWQRQIQLDSQRELLDELSNLTALLQSSLEQSSRDLARRQRDTEALEALINERLLWLPTQAVLSFGWIRRLPEGIADLLKPSRWGYTVDLLVGDMRAKPLQWSVSLVVAILLWILRRQAFRRLPSLASRSQRTAVFGMAPTVQALLISAFGAAFWPIAIWMLGDQLQQLGTTGKFTDSLGLSLTTVAPNVAILTAVHWVTARDGLGSHLSWDADRCAGLSRLAGKLLWLNVPISLIVLLQGYRGSELGTETIARPLLMLLMVAIATIVWRTMRPGASLGVRGAMPQSFWHRKAHLPIPILLMVFALLQAAGYSQVSILLFSATLHTLFLVFVLLILRQLVLRWLVIQERALALKRQHERLQAEREARAADVGETSDAPPVAEAEEITVASIGSQTRRLLRATLVTLGGIGIFWVWSDLLPALDVLDHIAVWSLDGEGEGAAQQIVSIKLILLSLLTFTLTTIAARNLPGLLEIGLLQRVPIDAGTRYAVTSICRYIIVIGGLVYGISLLGVRWGHLQWMAAALTVGLGFGLQEIFANFVSGLILLFERPFRVGDTITVNNLSGTVTRIRTRATTIVDWDNKEIVVPNKTFITGQLVNWTLSDATTRITIKVGAAYSCDAEQVLQVLRELGAAHPRVLAEPKPTSWLMEFGASSVNFELRVFVSEIRDRLPVSTELSTAIHRRFRELGIEIPFPQVDLHVRDLPKQVASEVTPVVGST